LAGYRTVVTKAKVYVVAAIHIGEMCSVGFCDEHRKSAGPFFHPVHGNAAEEGVLSAFVQGCGFRAIGDEFPFFASDEGA
jgi:hypothetical protein